MHKFAPSWRCGVPLDATAFDNWNAFSRIRIAAHRVSWAWCSIKETVTLRKFKWANRRYDWRRRCPPKISMSIICHTLRSLDNWQHQRLSRNYARLMDCMDCTVLSDRRMWRRGTRETITKRTTITTKTIKGKCPRTVESERNSRELNTNDFLQIHSLPQLGWV